MSRKIFIVLGLIVLSYISGLAQCRDFTENTVVPQLGDFLLTGRYHSFTMKEGDEILIFKTLSKGIEYKFIVKAESQLPEQIIFVIKSFDNKVIYDSRDDNFNNEFVYNVTAPQRVKIYIKVPELNEPPHSGCVSLVIGMKKVTSD